MTRHRKPSPQKHEVRHPHTNVNVAAFERETQDGTLSSRGLPDGTYLAYIDGKFVAFAATENDLFEELDNLPGNLHVTRFWKEHQPTRPSSTQNKLR